MSDNEKKIKVTPYSKGNGAKIDIYSPNSLAVPHDTAHIKVSEGKKEIGKKYENNNG